ncbi:MAG: family transcriptional regulator, cyclic receptor protein [Clostridia bacterium]|jgi:CRP/FNR family transcriptional regulator|nr:transcriptional regulator, Crp/Fnr family [Clostridiales bacterium]MDK2985465.1 family transcriptional regulator, cyclic receptor protein [Clostridia bacterium]
MMHTKLLRKIDLFSDLSEDLLQKISELIVTQTYKKGETIFWEGDPGEAFYFLYSGKVKASKLFPTGQEIIICTLGPGDVFAEVTLLKKDQPYPVTATALEKSEVGFIKNKDLENLLKENSGLALELIRQLNNKLIEAHHRIRNMGVTDVFTRTVTILKKLSESFGKETGEGIKIELRLSRQDMANLVGTTRETISRVVSKLKNQEIIDVKGQAIIIKDMEALEEYLM